MTVKTPPFRKRAHQLIRQACRQRMVLISYGKSKVPITKDQCLKIINDVSVLHSDQQLARYLAANTDMLFLLIPGLNSKATYQLRQLKSEAQSILQQS